jgi:hypothetical protein
MEDLQKILADFRVVKEKFEEDGKRIIKQALDTAFEKNPQLKAIHWLQYMVIFNIRFGYSL